MSLVSKNILDSFLKGYSSLNLRPEIDFIPKIESFNNSMEIDYNALGKDWHKIGKDLEKSIRKYDNYTD